MDSDKCSSNNSGSVARCEAVGHTGKCSLIRLSLRAKHGGRVHMRVRSLKRPVTKSKECKKRGCSGPVNQLTLRTFGLYFCRPMAKSLVRFRAPCPKRFGGLFLGG